MDWPAEYQKDPSFALLKPLSELHWLDSKEDLGLYLTGQGRRLGKTQLLNLLSKLQILAEPYKEIATFLLNPFGDYDLKLVKIDLEQFLRQCFEVSPDNPWQRIEGLTKEGSSYISITEDKLLGGKTDKLPADVRSKIIEKQVRKRNSWKDTLKLASERQDGSEQFENTLLAEAIKENPKLLKQEEEGDGLAAEIFSKVSTKITVALGPEQIYKIVTVPILLGKHYLSRNAQSLWFGKGENFTRIIGSYARWDNARVIFFRKELDTAQLSQFESNLKRNDHLTLRGPWRGVTAKKNKLNCALVVNTEITEDHFAVYEWDFNASELEYEINALAD